MKRVTETEYLIIKRSRIHGRGGYAKCNIKQGTVLIEYVGPKITKAQSLEQCEKGNEYIYCLDDEFDLDGSVEWNPARFINHSCSPNSEAQEKNGRVWIVALRDIEAGEEITYDYCYDLEDYRDYPCRCGAPNCCGYMVAESLRGSIRRRNGATRRRSS